MWVEQSNQVSLTERELASMTALLNFSWAPLLSLGGLAFYLMLEGASTTAGGCGMSPRRPSNAVAMTVAPSGFLHLDIPPCQRSYIYVNTRKKKQKTKHHITTHKLRHTHASATFPCCSLKKDGLKGVKDGIA